MKGAIKSMLSAFGLAPASQADQLTKETRDLAARVAQLENGWHRRAPMPTPGSAGTPKAPMRSAGKQAAAKAETETDVSAPPAIASAD